MAKGKRPELENTAAETKPFLRITDPRDVAAIMGGTLQTVK